MTDVTLGNEWDLVDVVAERAQPTTFVNVYLNEVASYEKVQLLKQHTKAKPSEVDEIDTQLSKVQEELERSKYVFHLTAIPSRMREDIASQAAVKFPIKRTIFGEDEPENALTRLKYNNDLIWLAQITDVVNPDGKSRKTWTLEEISDFADRLPTKAQQYIDEAIKQLSLEAEHFTASSKNADF